MDIELRAAGAEAADAAEGKRETGANPVRSRHCKQGVRSHDPKATGLNDSGWEGGRG